MKVQTYTTLTALSSPLIDTIVTTTLIGITTASVTTSASSSPTLTTPLLGENIRTSNANPEATYTALTNALSSLPTATPSSSSCTSSTNSSSSNQSTGNLSSSQQQQQQQSSTSSPSNVSASRLSQSHILTLPHIDEDDEDENGHVSLPLRVSSYIVRKIVQTDNLINLNAGSSTGNNNVKNLPSNNNESTTTATSSSLTPSPKIKVSRIKFTQQQQPQQQPLSLSLSSSTSSDSESSVATIHQQQNISSSSGDNVSPNKMQAESGSIAELQKYHNKYLKNRRHTLANTAAINLR